MNLTDIETTSIGTVFDAVKSEAAARGVEITGSEIVGLIPRRALEDAAVHYLKLEDYRPELIVENRLARVLEERAAAAKAPPLAALAGPFVAAVAAPTATPGGGSVAAASGALAAALGEMVCGLTLKKQSLEQHHATADEKLRRLTQLRAALLASIDRDAESYAAVLGAMKLPKVTEAEQSARARAIEEATKQAARVPLETAGLAAETGRLIHSLGPISLPQAASDLVVAALMARAAVQGSLENVRTNLASIHDVAWVESLARQVEELARVVE
jgi:glutamate formiminotransferase/formiminotetrahydrofolate cyclodeaminase